MADEEVKLLHFIQEQARRDAEISLARRKCIELEETISDYHERCVASFKSGYLYDVGVAIFVEKRS